MLGFFPLAKKPLSTTSVATATNVKSFSAQQITLGTPTVDPITVVQTQNLTVLDIVTQPPVVADLITTVTSNLGLRGYNINASGR
jgi:hypothetical protein